MESRGKMGRGKGSGFDPQLGGQWDKFVGFLALSLRDLRNGVNLPLNRPFTPTTVEQILEGDCSFSYFLRVQWAIFGGK